MDDVVMKLERLDVCDTLFVLAGSLVPAAAHCDSSSGPCANFSLFTHWRKCCRNGALWLRERSCCGRGNLYFWMLWEQLCTLCGSCVLAGPVEVTTWKGKAVTSQLMMNMRPPHCHFLKCLAQTRAPLESLGFAFKITWHLTATVLKILPLIKITLNG